MFLLFACVAVVCRCSLFVVVRCCMLLVGVRCCLSLCVAGVRCSSLFVVVGGCYLSWLSSLLRAVGFWRRCALWSFVVVCCCWALVILFHICDVC